MVDVHDYVSRHKNMSAIKGKNTKPEIVLRKYLHRRGYRFRLHRKDLPGSPDIVMPKFKLVIFVNGCFWHRHFDCKYTTTPATRKTFWSKKFKQNQTRDIRNQLALLNNGWRILVVWECGLKHSLSNFSELDSMIKCNSKFKSWPSVPPRLQAERTRN
ncbi:Very-short-patch mismatch repair endonuclease (G-T specific) [Methylophaga thiooxydans]|uniref:Very short patch repair endonuclease n=2 Tax=Methylophaga thiooxydans TaxID=392484 RepID=A0A0A0BIJ8_9GAMM|nr:Very-short-patch mismatch repair endonuclease (G-T specific) [Methylophaga thiooxydans]